MKSPVKILILEHDALDIELLQYELKKSGLQHISKVVATKEEYEVAISDFKPQIILSDYSLPSFNAVAAFKIKQTLCPDIPFIIVSGTIGEEKAVELIKDGVTDYAIKGKLFTVIPKIYRALKEYNDYQEKLLADKKLMEYAQQITSILESIGDGFYAVDHDWKVTYWNTAAEKIIGLKREEIVGQDLWLLFPEARTLKFFDELHWAMEENRAVHFEECLPSLNSWFEVAAYPSPGGLSVYFKNINERIEQEKNLRIAIERYEVLSKATNDAIWDWDINTNNLHWNNSAYIIFGYKEEEVIKIIDWWHENIHPDDIERITESLNKCIQTNVTHWQDEYRFRCANGTYKYVYDRGFILLDENNKPYRMIGAMMDLTTLKELEIKLVQERVKHQKMLANATIEGQEKERAEIGRELHDNINQILATVKLYIEMAISNGVNNDLLKKGVQNVQLCINEIRKLSKSLVAYGIKELGIVGSIKELIESIEITQVFKIKFNYFKSIDSILNDQQKLTLYRIVQEQLNNIIKYANASDVIIELSFVANLVCLQISDNGIGFDPKENRKGIGLMNIQSRAELMNGSVKITSSKGNGCTVKVILPVESMEANQSISEAKEFLS